MLWNKFKLPRFLNLITCVVKEMASSNGDVNYKTEEPEIGTVILCRF